MPVTIYSVNTGRMRRVVSDDIQTDAQLITNNPPGLAEGVHTGPFVNQEELNQITGLVPANDRFVCLDTDFVVAGVFIGDLAAGDGMPGLTEVQHNTAKFGWRQLTDGTFQRSEADIEGDILRLTAARDHVDSDLFRDHEAQAPADDEPLTPAEIGVLIGTYNQQIATFLQELAARRGPRVFI